MKLEEYPFLESLYVPPSGPTKVENVDDPQERELVLFVISLLSRFFLCFSFADVFFVCNSV